MTLPAIVQKIVEEESERLKPISWAEASVLTLFAAVIVLWITREPGVPGWSRFMPTSVAADGKVTAYVVCLWVSWGMTLWLDQSLLSFIDL